MMRTNYGCCVIVRGERFQEADRLGKGPYPCGERAPFGHRDKALPTHFASQSNDQGVRVNSHEHCRGEPSIQQSGVCTIPSLRPEFCVGAGISLDAGARCRRHSRGADFGLNRRRYRSEKDAPRSPASNHYRQAVRWERFTSQCASMKTANCTSEPSPNCRL